MKKLFLLCKLLILHFSLCHPLNAMEGFKLNFSDFYKIPISFLSGRIYQTWLNWSCIKSEITSMKTDLINNNNNNHAAIMRRIDSLGKDVSELKKTNQKTSNLSFTNNLDLDLIKFRLRGITYEVNKFKDYYIGKSQQDERLYTNALNLLQKRYAESHKEAHTNFVRLQTIDEHFSNVKPFYKTFLTLKHADKLAVTNMKHIPLSHFPINVTGY